MGPGNRPLDLEWLEDFLALARSDSFSRAAQARAIAQPAFSRHIRALEEWVGTDLFDRSAHPVSLTEAGKRFEPAVQALLRRLLDAREQARAAEDEAARSLRFAATHALSLSFFPSWLLGLESRLTLGAIQMASDSLQACEDAMLQDRAQFLLCHGHPAVAHRLEAARFVSTRLADDLLLPVAAAQPSGAPQHRIGDASVPVLAYGETSGLGRIMRAVMPAPLDAAPFHTVFTSHHAVLLKTLALEGRGVAWLPRSLIGEELATGRLVEAGDPAWRVPVAVQLFRPRAPMSAAAEAVWQAVAG